METCQNLAAQIVNVACQEFQQLLDQQAFLAPMAQKASRQARNCKWLSAISATLLIVFLVVYSISLNMGNMTTNKNWFTIGFIPIGVMLVAILLLSHFDNKHRLYQKNIKTVAAGRLNYIKQAINLALMEHVCTNDDDYTSDFYFKRMKEISSGFFVDNFNSKLTPEETSEIRSWLKASWSACFQTN